MKSRKKMSVPAKLWKAGLIQKQIEREKQHHANVKASITAQRDILRDITDPIRRVLGFAKLLHDEVKERQHHKAKLSELEHRVQSVWE